MTEILTIIAITAGAFISTNMDNLLLLVAMYSRYEWHSGMVTAGYFAGMLLSGIIATIIGEAGDYIPLAYLGLLGVIPVMMGFFAVWKLFRNTPSGEIINLTTSSTRAGVFLALVATQLSNSADSIVIFSALFADSSDISDYVIAPTFLVMTGVFCGLAYYSLKHQKMSLLLDRYGKYVTPFILIGVGFYILSNTATDLVPG